MINIFGDESTGKIIKHVFYNEKMVKLTNVCVLKINDRSCTTIPEGTHKAVIRSKLIFVRVTVFTRYYR